MTPGKRVALGCGVDEWGDRQALSSAKSKSRQAPTWLFEPRNRFNNSTTRGAIHLIPGNHTIGIEIVAAATSGAISCTIHPNRGVGRCQTVIRREGLGNPRDRVSKVIGGNRRHRRRARDRRLVGDEMG
jgi:hypothetical protein